MEEFKITEGHLEYLIGEKKNKFTIFVQAGDKVEEIQNVKVLFKDDLGYTLEAVKYMGKNRRIFVPMKAVAYLRSELH